MAEIEKLCGKTNYKPEDVENFLNPTLSDFEEPTTTFKPLVSHFKVLLAKRHQEILSHNALYTYKFREAPRIYPVVL